MSAEAKFDLSVLGARLRRDLSALKRERREMERAHTELASAIPPLRAVSCRRAEALSASAAEARRTGAAALERIEATAEIAARVDPKVSELAGLLRERRFLSGVQRARALLQSAASADSALAAATSAAAAEDGGSAAAAAAAAAADALGAATNALCALLEERGALEAVVGGASVSAQLEIFAALDARAQALRQRLRSCCCAQIRDALDAMGWPLRAELCVEEAGDETEAATAAAAEAARLDRFRDVFAVALRVERRVAASPVVAVENVASACWAVETACAPIAARLRYHYCADKQTNRADKPEWLFSEVIDQARLHVPFFEAEIDPILDAERAAAAGSRARCGAEVDAVAALLGTLVAVAIDHMEMHWESYVSVRCSSSSSSGDGGARAVRPLLSHAADAAAIFHRQLLREFSYGEDDGAAGAVPLSLAAPPLPAPPLPAPLSPFVRSPARRAQWAASDGAFAAARLGAVLAAPDAWEGNAGLSGATTLAAVEAIDTAPPPAAAALLGVLSALRARWSALPLLSDRAAYFSSAARPLIRVHFLDAVWRWAQAALGLRRGLRGIRPPRPSPLPRPEDAEPPRVLRPGHRPQPSR